MLNTTVIEDDNAMAPPPLTMRQGVLPARNPEPLAGTVSGVALSMIAMAILSGFLTERFLHIKSWRRLPLVVWVVFAIFIDSWAFVFLTAILQHGLGVNESYAICQGAIILCLVCYVTTKLIYFFLVEKAYLVRRSSSTKPRLKSKLYRVNSFGMLSVYCVVSALNFVFRITRVENGQCIIGMKKIAMGPLISFDILANVYLTILFIIPLRHLNSTKIIQPNERLRTIAKRTFFGACCTTISSVANLSVLMMLEGEPGWVCLLCCNIDIVFSAFVIHWVTSRDHRGASSDSWHYYNDARGNNNNNDNNNNNNNENDNGNNGSSQKTSVVSQPIEEAINSQYKRTSALKLNMDNVDIVIMSRDTGRQINFPMNESATKRPPFDDSGSKRHSSGSSTKRRSIDRVHGPMDFEASKSDSSEPRM